MSNYRVGGTVAHGADIAWAKAASGGPEWLSVASHCRDASAVAGRLWDVWLPERTRAIVAGSLVEPASARALVRLLAGLHDLGKISPAFAAKRRERLPDMVSAGLRVSPAAYGRGPDLPHGVAGAWCVERWLRDRGWAAAAAYAWGAVISGHHGRPPAAPLSIAPSVELIGGDAWERARVDLLEHLIDVTHAAPYLAGWGSQPLSVPAQMVVSGVVIVADWLASNSDSFPLTADGSGDAGARADTAWSTLALPPPWQPTPSDKAPPDQAPTDPNFWASRFDFGGHPPRPMQQALKRLVEELADPRLLIVEDSMGSGKTEAALAAAELLAARYGCGGVIVALPTMATSDAMFSRVLDWLRRLSPSGQGQQWSTYLAHGRARLNDEFTGLRPDSAMDAVYDDQDPCASVIAHSWLAGRRKGVLSSFVVGTIDQVLIAGLRTKFLALRHLALSGKVVVIDEVHASDEYMQVFEARVLAWLGAYGVPVVLLSATLPPQRRAALIAAYRGATAPNGRPRAGVTSEPATLPTDVAYPRITSLDGGTVRQHPVPPSRATVAVTLRTVHDEGRIAVLEEALAAGGTAAVVCNTVKRAQQVATEARAVFGDDVLLVHSRFLAADRQEKEQQVRKLLGPGDAGRPERLVLVGTQVLEQSLDIDVDVMISDLAPTDLLLQRIGRLHRHDRALRPARVATPVCHLAGVQDWTADPPTAVRGSQYVYGEALLLRTAATLRPFLQGNNSPLRLPDDISALVGRTFRPYRPDDPAWPAELRDAEAAADKKQQDRERRARDWLLRPPHTSHPTLYGAFDQGIDEEIEGRPAVRDGDPDVEVLLLPTSGHQHWLPAWIEGGAELGPAPSTRLSLAALGCVLRLPGWIGHAVEAAEASGDLSRPPAWERSPWLQGLRVLACRPDGDRLIGQLSDRHVIHYSQRDGLTVGSPETP